MRNRVRCVTIGVAGGAVLLVGIGLLVLPGPGLLLVLAGSIVLAAGFPPWNATSTRCAIGR